MKTVTYRCDRCKREDNIYKLSIHDEKAGCTGYTMMDLCHDCVAETKKFLRYTEKHNTIKEQGNGIEQVLCAGLTANQKKDETTM